MSNEVAVTSTAIAMSEKELLTVLENSLYPGASQDSIKLVIGYCKAAGLDPIQKPVHIVPIWDSKTERMRDVVMPGIGMYRTQAARGGNYAGVSEPEFGPDINEKIGGQDITYPAWCKVAVKRRLPTGEIVEFSATERWKENYAVKGGKEKSIAPNAMWTRRPYAQLAKCAEAQALRKAFPEFGSQPTADEMEGKTLNEDAIDGQVVTREEAKTKGLPACTDEQFNGYMRKGGVRVTNGESTSDEFITWLSAKFVLTDAQKEAIRDLVPKTVDAEFVGQMDEAEGGAE